MSGPCSSQTRCVFIARCTKLKAAGIELAQGFYFSPPLSAEAFEMFARSRQ